VSNHRLLSLLARWHQWRRAYSLERGHARVRLGTGEDAEDELERLTMQAIEDEMDFLEPLELMALQHVARAECMGVEVITNPRLGGNTTRARLVEHALSVIEKRLLRAGIL